MRSPPRRLLLSALLTAPLLAFAAPAAADDAPPALRWDQPVSCYNLKEGKTLRVQCTQDAKGETCLVAPGEMVGIGDPLDKVQPCTPYNDDAYRDLARRARIVPAVAEAPPGYARGESGRAFQVKFDLLNRFYIGVGWAPTLQSSRGFAIPAGFPFARANAEMGIHLSILSPRRRARHDLRILEGSATFADLELRGTLLSYDYQHEHRRPLFWISTFFGEPDVFPILPRMGFGFRVLSVLDRQPSFRDALDMEFGEFHVAWNPWQSDDMYSHLRVEIGGNFGAHWQDRTIVSGKSGNYFLGPTAAIETRISLGKGGLHYLFSDLTFRRPTIVSGDLTGETVNRLAGSFAYEGVLVAINDQPISVRLAAEGRTQNDFVRDVRAVELRFFAGLRMSFGAPPRVFEPMPAFEDP
ncbi:hypothetical protein [Polyangium mundeleinium]|uniref:Uncharacterized protein n=1 Tax=Polyangium mundeleinium TaxID=2995306 RepID=A0ABT5EX16_9BACT|nr:hypothetical protein [Polyangium mundeleinium]MDC0746353.1 hypothetical protein [Polyangium mundeleinium]